MTALLFSCRPKAAEQDIMADLSAELPGEFAEFYERFMTDSLYQMEHILFPLQGIPDRADSATLAGNSYRWQMDSWLMHHPIEGSSGFSIDLRPVTDTYILEKILHESGQYAMERRWAFMDDGWYLIYYAGLNPVSSGQ